eukprot:5677137-Alexandrium_andersonii.AAC.2
MPLRTAWTSTRHPPRRGGRTQKARMLARLAQAIARRRNSVTLQAQRLHCSTPVQAQEPRQGRGSTHLGEGEITSRNQLPTRQQGHCQWAGLLATPSRWPMVSPQWRQRRPMG